MKNIRKIYSQIARVHDFLHRLDSKLTYFVIPTFLSLGSAFLEGIGITLLLPLVKGILQMDFSFVQETRVMQFIMYRIFHVYSRPHIFIFIFLTATIFVTLALGNIMRYFASTTVLYQLRKFSDRLRRLIFNRYLSFGKLFFDRHNLGYLHNILINFTGQIAYEFHNLQDAFDRIFSLIIYLIIMGMISLRLTLLVILVLPILNYAVHWIIEKIKKTSTVYSTSSKRITEQIFNILSCIPLVKIYAHEEHEKEEFNTLSNNLRRVEFSLDRKNQLISPINEIIVLIIVLFLISLMSFMVIKEKAGQVSSFLIFFLVLRKASNSFYFINIIKNSLATISGQAAEIMKIFDDKDKFFVMGGKKDFPGLKNRIELRHLNFSYTDDIQVLNSISFTIEKGKITALVGPSGAGKTTLVNLILRFYECLPSSIFIDGMDIMDFTLESLRKDMALVSQDTLLFNDTLKNNIIYGLDREVTEAELIDILKKSRLYDFVTRLPGKLDAYIGDRGVKLSGGEKQRVTIARALLKSSEILILDEATSSLDSKTEKLIQDAIAEAIRGRTTIVIAHRLSTIKNADKIVVIEEGEFIEEGTLDELLDKKGKFYEYWQEQKFY
ncbi:MAG: ABC transporter ATP-binding protein [Candidatus Omnitrophota bacterium]|nr:ABC transporter ATP-binding protein [Candidatus Omnitrophota bacterium]